MASITLRLLFLFTACGLPLAAEPQIIETSHIAEVLPLIDANTWFLVDLDNTLFEGRQALGHANWFYDQMQQRLDNGMSKNDAIREVYPEWVKVQDVCPVKPLETNFAPSIILLQNQGIVVMGLTHRQPSVAEATVRQVQSLGIDFSKTAPSKNSFTIPAQNPTLYVQGILFVHDFNKKGEVFQPFLAILGQQPKRIVFIDDKKKNVEEMAVMMDQLGIAYIGVFYRAIESAPPVYSRDIADFQYKFLDKIMSNEAAQLLMTHNLE